MHTALRIGLSLLTTENTKVSILLNMISVAVFGSLYYRTTVYINLFHDDFCQFARLFKAAGEGAKKAMKKAKEKEVHHRAGPTAKPAVNVR